jgi:hypothetical protein
MTSSALATVPPCTGPTVGGTAEGPPRRSTFKPNVHRRNVGQESLHHKVAAAQGAPCCGSARPSTRSSGPCGNRSWTVASRSHAIERLVSFPLRYSLVDHLGSNPPAMLCSAGSPHAMTGGELVGGPRWPQPEDEPMWTRSCGARLAESPAPCPAARPAPVERPEPVSNRSGTRPRFATIDAPGAIFATQRPTLAPRSAVTRSVFVSSTASAPRSWSRTVSATQRSSARSRMDSTSAHTSTPLRRKPG